MADWIILAMVKKSVACFISGKNPLIWIHESVAIVKIYDELVQILRIDFWVRRNKSSVVVIMAAGMEGVRIHIPSITAAMNDYDGGFIPFW